MGSARSIQEDLVPGTRRLFDEHGNTVPGEEHLKKHGDIVLVPQPSDSPDDPLNWSLARKIWHTTLVLFVVGLTAATSNDAGSGSDAINQSFGISYDVFNTGAGVLFIGIGYWCLLSSPVVHLYGRRISYLISMVWGVIGSIWYARIATTADTIWSQLFVGGSEAVAEAVVQLSLLDIWFEHQNGTSLGLYTLATAVGTYLGPLVASHLGDALGWRWIGYSGAIISGGTFLVLYFGLEETQFHREHLLDQASSIPPQEDVAAGDESKVVQERLGFSKPKRSTYWERIRPITPAPNLQGTGAKQFVNRLWHTMRVFTFPAVWYAGLQWGMQNICLTFTLTVQEDYWYGPPWNYDTNQVGNMNLPALIGSVIGCFYGGWCSDKFLLWMTKRNGGVMEAEHRLYLMALCTAVFPTGIWLFGIGSAAGWDWPVPYIGLGFVGFGYGCAGDLSITYLADSYPEMILEGMVGVCVINNTLAMIFSFVTSYWLDTGLRDCFIEIGAISFVVLGLSLPVILWGKRWRRWTKANYFKFVEIRDGMM
jgi:MFS family permease